MNVRQLATRIDADPKVSPRGRPQSGAAAQQEGRSTFASQLKRARLGAMGTTISSHAWQRIEQRGISMTDAEQHRLGEAMKTLAAKGARDALLMRADAAFVVNVPNRTVITAIDRHEMQQRIFTQIDSAMLV